MISQRQDKKHPASGDAGLVANVGVVMPLLRQGADRRIRCNQRTVASLVQIRSLLEQRLGLGQAFAVVRYSRTGVPGVVPQIVHGSLIRLGGGDGHLGAADLRLVHRGIRGVADLDQLRGTQREHQVGLVALILVLLIEGDGRFVQQLLIEGLQIFVPHGVEQLLAGSQGPDEIVATDIRSTGCAVLGVGQVLNRAIDVAVQKSSHVGRLLGQRFDGCRATDAPRLDGGAVAVDNVGQSVLRHVRDTQLLGRARLVILSKAQGDEREYHDYDRYENLACHLRHLLLGWSQVHIQ